MLEIEGHEGQTELFRQLPAMQRDGGRDTTHHEFLRRHPLHAKAPQVEHVESCQRSVVSESSEATKPPGMERRAL